MSTCYVHEDAPSVGTCVSCGKFICVNCNTELKGKNTCKRCIEEIFEENKRKLNQFEHNGKVQQPMVFMNAGGASSSASSRQHEETAEVPHYTKDKTIAGLLAILLGSFGIHKFYLGEWIQGIVYLIFFWTYVPLFLGLIEGIRYLILTDERFASQYDKGYRTGRIRY